MPLSRVLFLLLFGFALCVVSPVWAGSATLVIHGDPGNNIVGNWSDPTRWSSNPTFPKNGNASQNWNAFITGIQGGTTTLDVPVTLDGLTFRSGTLVLSQPLTVATLAMTIERFPPSSSISAPHLMGNGDVTVSGAMTFHSGEIGGTGLVSANGGLTIDMSDTSSSGQPVVRAGRTINNGGSAVFRGSNQFQLDGTMHNLITGTWTAEQLPGVDHSINMFGSGTFQNSGIYEKKGSSYADYRTRFVNESTGVVNVQAGALSLSGSANQTGTWNIFGGATLVLTIGSHVFDAQTVLNLNAGSVLVMAQQGTATFNSPVTSAGSVVINGGILAFNGTTDLTSLSLSHTPKLDSTGLQGGVIGGNGTINVSNHITWTNGGFTGSGVVNANEGVTMNPGNEDDFHFFAMSGRTLNVGGTTSSFETAIPFEMAGGAHVHNLVGSVFTLNPPQNNQIMGGNTEAWSNAGTMVKAGAFNLEMRATISNTGTFSLEGGTFIVRNSGGSYTQTAGETRLAGGSIDCAQTVPMAIQGGMLTGAGTISGKVAVTNGEVSPDGTLNVTSDLTLTAQSSVLIDITDVANNGTVSRDQITESGSVPFACNGALAVHIAPAARGKLPGGDHAITIITSNAPPLGQFAGLDNGRVNVDGGLGSFAVSIVGNSVVLNDYISPVDIAVQTIAGVNLNSGGTFEFGQVTTGTTKEVTLAIKNVGLFELNGLAVTKDAGADAAQFTVDDLALTALEGPDGVTYLTLRFAPTGLGAKIATIHIASNDPDENPFHLTLAGTGIAVPVVATLGATELGATFATLTGSVTAAFANTHAVFEYGLTDAYGSEVDALPLPVVGNVATAVSADISGLLPLTTYHFRVKATNEAGTTVGDDHIFATLSDLAGDVDTSFNVITTGGAVRTSAVQPDGKIIIAGGFDMVGGVARARVARLNRDGSVDTAFDADINPSYTPPGGGASQPTEVSAIIVQNDGIILIGGFFQTVDGQPQRSIARLLGSSGARDPSFTNADVPSLVCMSLQQDGTIIIGGPFAFSHDSKPYAGLLRLNSNGSVDYSYFPTVDSAPPEGVTGLFPSPTPVTLGLQSDGKLIVGGYFGALNGNSIYNLGRITILAESDAPFASAHGDIVGQVYCTVVQKDGKSLIGGDFPGHLKHLTSTGAIAPGFSVSVDGRVTSIAMQADGRSIVSGDFTMINSTPRSGIARFADNGTLTGFDTATAQGSLTMQANGRVLATTSTGLARLMNGVATQTLTAVTTSKVRWVRSGTSPEAESVTFDFSDDGGATWQPQGHGTRVPVELSTWELDGLNLPVTGMLRARARVPCGQFNSSSSLIESVTAFDATPANVTAEWNSADDVGVTAASFSGEGKAVTMSLNFDPLPGTSLMIVKNTGLRFIAAPFNNLAQGESVTLSHDGKIYRFVANYYGGSGNDLVLQWADTRVAQWGTNEYPGHLPPEFAGIAQSNRPLALYNTGALAGKTVIAATGSSFNRALCSDGTLVGWADIFNINQPAAFTAIPLPGKTPIAIASGQYHGLVLCTDGTVMQWGDIAGVYYATPVQVSASSALNGKSVVAVSTGYSHSLALTSDGTVVGWGENGLGELGVGAFSSALALPAAADRTGVLAGKSVIAIAGGGYHSVALCSDGTLAAWGGNFEGQLGNGSLDASPVPVAVDQTGVLAGKTVIAIAAGQRHTLALCSDGTLAAWGSAVALGNNTVDNSPVPVLVDRSDVLSGRTVVQIQAGDEVSFARCSDGNAVAWGLNSYGQLGDGTTTDATEPGLVSRSALPAGAAFASIGQTSRGIVGLVLQPQLVVEQPVNTPLTNDASTIDFGSVASGSLTRTITLLNVGSAPLSIAGVNIDGVNATDFAITTAPASTFQAGGSTSFIVTFTPPNGSGLRSAALHIISNDGATGQFNLSLFGAGNGGQVLTAAFDDSAATALSLYSFTATGRTVSPSLNFEPAAGTGLTLVNNLGLGFIQGSFSNLAQGQLVTLMHEGTAYNFTANYFGGTGNDLVLQWAATRLMAWGNNYNGTLGNGTRDSSNLPLEVNRQGILSGKTVIAMSAGWQSVAACSDGTLAQWFIDGNDPQIDPSTAVPMPVDQTGVLAGKKVIALSQGMYHTLALCSDGTLAAWGGNYGGLLGDGSTTDSSIPVAVNTTGALLGKTVVAISSGSYHNLALCSDGTVVGWGLNNGALGDGSAVGRIVPVAMDQSGVLKGKRVIAIAARDFQSLVLCSDGTLAEFGTIRVDPIGSSTTAFVPTLVDQSGVLAGKIPVAITSGGYHSLVLCSDGTLASWGSRTLGNGTTAQSYDSLVQVDQTGVLAGKTVVRIAAGNAHSLVHCSDGTIAAWGNDYVGELGDGGNTDEKLVPVLTQTGGEVYTAIAAGTSASHSFGLAAAPSGARIAVQQPAGSASMVSGSSAVVYGEVTKGGVISKSFAIQNIGGSPLTLGAITIDGASASDFTITTTASGTIASFDSKPLTVVFTPQALGSRTATLHIASNDLLHSSFTIALDGTGLVNDLVFATSSIGRLHTVSMEDHWTFTGRRGQAVSVVLNPGLGASPLPPIPPLQWARMELLNASNVVLGSASSANEGQIMTLTNLMLPSDGTYYLRVTSAAAHANATGNYVVTAFDSSTNVRGLNLNQQHAGKINVPFLVDAWSFTAAAGDQVQLHPVGSETPYVRYKLSGPGGFVGFVDQEGDSVLINLPAAGTYTLEVSQLYGSTGSYSFVMRQSALTTLTSGVPMTGAWAGSGQAQLYSITTTLRQPLSITFSDSDTTHFTELYLRRGAPPTRQRYDSTATSSLSSKSLLVGDASADTWYVLVYGQFIPNESGAFSVMATSSSMFISEASSTIIDMANSSDIMLRGAGFYKAGVGTVTASLVAANGTELAASATTLEFGGQLRIHFDAASVPAGIYTLKLTRPDGEIATLLPTVTALAGVPHFTASFDVPNPLGRHVAATLYINYTNDGNAPMPAPVLTLEMVNYPTIENPNYLPGSEHPITREQFIPDLSRPQHGAFLTLDPSRVIEGIFSTDLPVGYSHSVQILASGATPGVLQPGESVRVPVYYAGWSQPLYNFQHTDIGVYLRINKVDDPRAKNWVTEGNKLRPPGISEEAWNVMFTNHLLPLLGTTEGGYARLMNATAGALASRGKKVTLINKLWDFAVAQAENTWPVSKLGTTVDHAVPRPGAVPLNFVRSFNQSIPGRFREGPLGLGWFTEWDQSAGAEVSTVENHSEPPGNVTFFDGDGGVRIFQPDSRSPLYKFFPPIGDYSNLTTGLINLSGTIRNTYQLTALDGTVSEYLEGRVSTDKTRGLGRLRHITDANGNRVTTTYTSAGITDLSASSGQSMHMTYNAAGRITDVTDSMGRVTHYTYAPGNLHLMAVTAFDGKITSYTYDTNPASLALNALTSITFPDGKHRTFSYDSLGRLSGIAEEGGAQSRTIAYPTVGQVTMTDANNHSTSLFYDQNGQMAKIANALGDPTYFEHDEAFNLTAVIAATGISSTIDYDANGMPTTATDFGGNITQFEYNGAQHQLSRLTDARGNQTQFSYNSAGNLTGTTNADGTTASLTRDAQGNPLTMTNAASEPISYTHNAGGQLTCATFSNGSSFTYSYNSQGQITAATDATGTITFTYDAVTRLLSDIAYPGGKALHYSYDLAGRRTQMVDQSGFTTKYGYDTVGQLTTLKDASDNLITTYSYDDAGQLSQKTNVNGTFTTYAYDAAGRLLHLINHAPDSSITSRFDDTYDVLGVKTSQTTLQGVWTYTHDTSGQLTRAVFASNNPATLPNQDLSYNYDAVGNRTSTVINGVTTSYVTNSVNQYTSVGGNSFSYDLKGNLLSDGSNTYAYDVLNRLVSVTTGTGTTTYAYNSLGQRVSLTASGQTTKFLIDPAGFGNVIGTYSSSGSLIANFTHGLGLVSQESPSVSSYFDFDTVGSTAAVTNSLGANFNAYSYLPFGESLSVLETAPNAIRFTGQWGALAETRGLTFMRARYQSPALGRFTSSDPLRFNGGDVNLYRYVFNRPDTLVDPTGLSAIDWLKGLAHGWGVGVGANVATGQSPDLAGNVISTAFGIPGAPGAGNAFAFAADPVNAVNLVNGLLAPGRSGIKDPRIQDIFAEMDGTPSVRPSPTPDAPGDPSLEEAVRSVAAVDPNALYGPAGFGAANFVALTGRTFDYRITYENDSDASAPAQGVTITNNLDERFDLSTFRLTAIGFGDHHIVIPDGSQHYEGKVSMSYNGQTFDVEMEAGIHGVSGQVYAIFQSIVPTNGLPPSDPLIGFLPPEDGTGRGQGFLTYSVTPKVSTPTGAVIPNVAVITFDGGESIATNQVNEHNPALGTDPAKEARVTIDANIPTAQVTAIPGTYVPTSFSLSWTGNAGVGGSGVASYTVFVSDNGGASYLPWLVDTQLTSSVFTGTAGVDYKFYVLARSNVGTLQTSNTVNAAITARPLSPVNYWRWQNFSIPTNIGIAADSKDFDSDGSENLLEFAIGTDPRNGTNSGLTFADNMLTRRGLPVASGDDVSFDAIFARRKDYVTAGLTYTVEFSANLSDWESSALLPTVLATDAELDVVSVPFPALLVSGLQPKFFRVTISIAP